MKGDFDSSWRRYFSDELRTAKDAGDLTQEQLAEVLQISPRSVAELTAGRTGPRGQTLARFLAYLCDNPDSFIKGYARKLGGGRNRRAVMRDRRKEAPEQSGSLFLVVKLAQEVLNPLTKEREQFIIKKKKENTKHRRRGHGQHLFRD